MTDVHTALTYVAGLGYASTCTAYLSDHRPKPLRFVWHHVLPQVCGGKTVKENLASLCDVCHYNTHALMWLLGQHQGDTSGIHGWSRLGSQGQRALAFAGYQAAVAAGTVDKIPHEGGMTGE